MVRDLDVEIVREQLKASFDDIEIHAVKIGMVSNIDIIDTIGDCLKATRLIP